MGYIFEKITNMKYARKNKNEKKGHDLEANKGTSEEIDKAKEKTALLGWRKIEQSDQMI